MKIRKLAVIAMIAALYTGVSILLAPFSFGSIQVRVAEVLTLLPVLLTESIIAVTLGCFLTNLIGVLSGNNMLGIIDIIFGTLTTLIAALLTRRFAKVVYRGYPWLSALPPIILNALVVGAELAYVLSPSGSFSWQLFWLYTAQVGLGQFLAVFVLGLPLIKKLAESSFLQSKN